jgi:hypothetical protein
LNFGGKQAGMIISANLAISHRLVLCQLHPVVVRFSMKSESPVPLIGFTMIRFPGDFGFCGRNNVWSVCKNSYMSFIYASSFAWEVAIRMPQRSLIHAGRSHFARTA